MKCALHMVATLSNGHSAKPQSVLEDYDSGYTLQGTALSQIADHEVAGRA